MRPVKMRQSQRQHRSETDKKMAGKKMDNSYEKKWGNDSGTLVWRWEDELTFEREEYLPRSKRMENRYTGWVKGCARNRDWFWNLWPRRSLTSFPFNWCQFSEINPTIIHSRSSKVKKCKTFSGVMHTWIRCLPAFTLDTFANDSIRASLQQVGIIRLIHCSLQRQGLSSLSQQEAG